MLAGHFFAHTPQASRGNAKLSTAICHKVKAAGEIQRDTLHEIARPLLSGKVP